MFQYEWHSVKSTFLLEEVIIVCRRTPNSNVEKYLRILGILIALIKQYFTMFAVE